jgi:hypothetical protein
LQKVGVIQADTVIFRIEFSNNIIYVTIRWQSKINRQITQDHKRYQVPENLSKLVKIIISIISG